MKKLLIASTALVATAGVAAADVTLSGTARFGVQYNDSSPFRGGSDVELEKRMTLNIDAATQTDAGVEFGARARIRSDENVGTAVNGAYVYASANGFTVRAGNIVSAIEAMPNLYSASVGLTGLQWTGLATNVAGTGTAGAFAWDAYSSRGNGAEGLEVIYSMDAFTFHVSASPDRQMQGGSPRLVAAYGAYSFDGWTVALAAQDSSEDLGDKIGITVDGNLGDFGVGAQLFDNDGTTKASVYGSATFDQITGKVFVARQDSEPGIATRTTFGVGADYDLGGATLRGGIARNTAKDTLADFGVTFSF